MSVDILNQLLLIPLDKLTNENIKEITAYYKFIYDVSICSCKNKINNYLSKLKIDGVEVLKNKLK